MSRPGILSVRKETNLKNPVSPGRSQPAIQFKALKSSEDSGLSWMETVRSARSAVSTPTAVNHSANQIILEAVRVLVGLSVTMPSILMSVHQLHNI